MRAFFTRNLGWKVLSLVIAIGLWVSVAREPEVATSLSVPVDFKNMQDNLDIEGTLPTSVRVELRGPSGQLTRENLSTVAVVLDLSDAHPGERTYSIRSNNLDLPSGVVFYRAVPSQLTLHFDALETKQVPVDLVFRDQPPGYTVTSQFSPTTILIRGPQARVEPLRDVKTDPMDLTDLPTQDFHTHLNIGDPQVRILEAPTDIAVRVELQKIPVQKTPKGGAH